MTAAILVAVLTNIVATVGFAFQLSSRIDALGARLDTRIDSLGEAFIRHDHGAH
jgi:hypothetical protein